MTRRIHNFSAGPAALPLPVLESVQRNLVDYERSGMSLMEQSHRGPIYDEVHNRCIADLRELLSVPENYEVIFLGGGARTAFTSLAMNLLTAGESAGYINTGNWSKGAISEARKQGTVKELWTSAETNFDRVPAPEEVAVPDALGYLHYTSNNTIYGTEFHHIPASGDAPLVCDMSSDICSRPVDVSRFGMIYAGAQKNMGPAGVVVLILRKDLLERCGDHLPETLNYRKVAAKNSMLNTPPVFAIYMVGLVARHLLDLGGLEAMDAINERKSNKLYAALETSGFYALHAQEASRSRMNVTFRSPDADLDKRFVAEALEADLNGLKGHRLVGGLRASIYNAVPEASVDALLGFLADFEARNG